MHFKFKNGKNVKPFFIPPPPPPPPKKKKENKTLYGAVEITSLVKFLHGMDIPNSPPPKDGDFSLRNQDAVRILSCPLFWLQKYNMFLTKKQN